jgi:hypothetical protein
VRARQGQTLDTLREIVSVSLEAQGATVGAARDLRISGRPAKEVSFEGPAREGRMERGLAFALQTRDHVLARSRRRSSR